MPQQSPSEKQARVLWTSLTALAVGILLGLVGLLAWGFGWLLQQLSSVLLPLAIAGVIAYLLDPIVDFLERRKVPRSLAILLVFTFALITVSIVLAIVVPRLITEGVALAKTAPGWPAEFETKIESLQKKWPVLSKLKEAWTPELQQTIKDWFTNVVPTASGWLLAQAGRVASWLGLVVGLALVPVYAFYLLLEKSGIQRSWTDYLPVRESRLKEEAVFVLNAINDYLILFFRGQVLVALCDGVLYTVGLFAIGLNYALLLGVMAGLLSIVPFLGFVISIVPAIIIAAVQYGDWLHPLLVLIVFSSVQMIEGLVISPKIMGDRVGLHPLTVIIAVMIGTTLMGGILGGILAIPLTAALRVVMFRYVWKQSGAPERDDKKARRRSSVAIAG